MITLLGIRATLEDLGALVTGAVMACYYAGVITSSFAAPHQTTTETEKAARAVEEAIDEETEQYRAQDRATD